MTGDVNLTHTAAAIRFSLSRQEGEVRRGRPVTAYDSAPETLAHVRRVGDFLALASSNLVRRAAKHDHSKVCAPEKKVEEDQAAFDAEILPLLARLDRIGSGSA